MRVVTPGWNGTSMTSNRSVSVPMIFSCPEMRTRTARHGPGIPRLVIVNTASSPSATARSWAAMMKVGDPGRWMGGLGQLGDTFACAYAPGQVRSPAQMKEPSRSDSRSEGPAG